MKNSATPSPVLLLAFLVACGGANKTPQQFFKSNDTVDVAEVMKTAKVVCTNEAKEHGLCSESTAFINMVIRDSWDGQFTFGSCTGFYLGNKIMMTNNHCIPEHLNFPEQSCETDLQATFLNGEQIACEKIINTSSPLMRTRINLDYAFFLLTKEPSVEALKLSDLGLQETEQYIIPSIDPYNGDNSFYGEMNPRKCSPIPDTVWLPSYSSKNSNRDKTAIVPLIKCDNIGGNSGSPVLASDGSVRAILHSVIYPSTLKKSLSAFFSNHNPNSISFVTNFACFIGLDTNSLPTHSFKYQTNSSCPQESNLPSTQQFSDHFKNQIKSDDMASVINKSHETAQNEINEWIKKTESTDSDLSKNFSLLIHSFSQQTQGINYASVYIADTSCIKNIKQHQKSSSPNIYTDKVEIESSRMPLISVLTGLDENHKVSVTIKRSTHTARYVFSPKEIIRKTYTELTKTLMPGPELMSLRQTIRLCGEQ